MKKLILIMLICAGIAANSQNILRVNNIPIVDAPYRTINAALAAAATDDVILVEGSPTTYSESLTLTKRVKIIGTGYFLSGSGLQANPYPAIIESNPSIRFNTGSEGSKISGFEITGGVEINVAGITFSNNNVAAVVFSASNITIKENYIHGFVARSGGVGTLTDIYISNNYLGVVSMDGFFTYSVITNNIIAGNSYNNQVITVNNAQINNNIFLATVNLVYTAPIVNATNTTFLNNLFIAPVQPGADPANGNQFNHLTSLLFVGGSGDTQWKLKVGSPAIGAGVSAVDCGMYGGANPYRPSGILPGQPTITSFTTPGSVPANGTLNVKVSAKVN